MNSFRFIERGIRAEIARQEKILTGGGQILQETLHFDPGSGAITSLRSKEEAHDYRYFPEPDLVPVAIDEQMIETARAAMPELPASRAARYEREFGLSAASAQLLAFRFELGDYFEAALAARRRPRATGAGACQLDQPASWWGAWRTERTRQPRAFKRAPWRGSSGSWQQSG